MQPSTMASSSPDDIIHGHGHAGSVDVKFHDSVAVVTFRCGENRFNNTFLKRVNDALDKVEANPDAKVLITTSVGKFYSAGLDLPWLLHLGTKKESDSMDFLVSFIALVSRVLAFPLPTIACINGHAAAGGAILSLAHDMRIMRSDRGFFYINEVRIGLPLQGPVKALIQQKLGQVAFTEAAVLGKRLTATDTQRLGITSLICEEKMLLNSAIKMANDLLTHGPIERNNLRVHKENLYEAVLKPTGTPVKRELLNYGGALKLSKM